MVPGKGMLPSGASLIQWEEVSCIHPPCFPGIPTSSQPLRGQRGWLGGHDGFGPRTSGAVAAPLHPSVLPALEFGVPGGPRSHGELSVEPAPLHPSPPLVAPGTTVGSRGDDVRLLPGLARLAPGWAAVRSWPLAQPLGRQPGWGGQRWVLSSFPPSIFPPLVFLGQGRERDNGFACVACVPGSSTPIVTLREVPHPPCSIPSRCPLPCQDGGSGTSPSAWCHELCQALAGTPWLGCPGRVRCLSGGCRLCRNPAAFVGGLTPDLA